MQSKQSQNCFLFLLCLRVSNYLCDSSLAQDNLDGTSLVNKPGLIFTVYMCRVSARPWRCLTAGSVGYVWKVTQ